MITERSPQIDKETDKGNYIDPQKIPILISRLHSVKEFEKGKANGRIFYLRKNPYLADMIWDVLYPSSDKKEKPFFYNFPNSLTLRPWEDGKGVLGVGFSNSLPVEITWDYNLEGVTTIKKKWLDQSGQNWTQYDHFQSAVLLNEDPWIAKVDRRVLEAMDGLLRVTDSHYRMRGSFITLSHYPGKGRVIQILYHFDIHGGTKSLRFLSSRILGERAKILNETYNHYLLYSGQIEEVFVPNMGKFQFVANMPLDRLLWNIFFPENFRPRDIRNPLNESLVEGQDPNFWEVNYIGER